MKEQILRMLRQQNQYISGQHMCKELGVSRTAVWKVINQLKEEGYVIEAVSNKGYVLKDSPDIVTDYEIMSLFPATQLVDHVICYSEIDSTNNKAKELALEYKDNVLLVADTQLAGRGSKGRSWVSPKGSGIWMSFLLHPAIQPMHASRLTLLAALAVAEAIREECGVMPQIKWPNDLLLNQKKICGILTEMNSEIEYIHYVIVGIGLNVHTKEFPEELTLKATSLALEGKKVKRSALISKIVKHFDKYYTQFLQTEDLSFVIEEYNQLLIHRNQKVKIVSPGSEQEGIARGIDETGCLLLELEDGTVKKIISGEVSLRGLHGYI